jgi:hypothetical protein
VRELRGLKALIEDTEWGTIDLSDPRNKPFWAMTDREKYELALRLEAERVVEGL